MDWQISSPTLNSDWFGACSIRVMACCDAFDSASKKLAELHLL